MLLMERILKLYSSRVEVEALMSCNMPKTNFCRGQRPLLSQALVKTGKPTNLTQEVKEGL